MDGCFEEGGCFLSSSTMRLASPFKLGTSFLGPIAHQYEAFAFLTSKRRELLQVSFLELFLDMLHCSALGMHSCG